MTEPARAHDEQADGLVARTVTSISEIDAKDWNRCAIGSDDALNPFVGHGFLSALEAAECVGPAETGWMPQHLVLTDAQEQICGAAPVYIKLHSRGEYVFDHAWAEAAHGAGLSYYPKLQVASPFTPVPGPRLLVPAGTDRAAGQIALASALVSLTERLNASSAHLTFLDRATWERLGDIGYLQRIDQQFHWHNDSYATFDDFLAALSSRKRKAIRKERRQARDSGLTFRTVRGGDIKTADWDALYGFYIDTGSRKWGTPYLNRQFFHELGDRIADSCVLMFADDGRRPIAGALHIIGGSCLYGRYWGATAYHPFLHFELCYYQAVDFAIANQMARVEAGAQGEHKLLRGYQPVPTFSAHWIADKRLRDAIARYLILERREVEHAIGALADFGPYKSAPDSGHQT